MNKIPKNSYTLFISLVLAVVFSLCAFNLVRLNSTSYIYQAQVKAKVLDFFPLKDPEYKDCGYYGIKYEYVIDGKKHIGGWNPEDWTDWFREYSPEFAPGKIITINVLKDEKGIYHCTISSLLMWVLLFTFSGLALIAWFVFCRGIYTARMGI